ncbi:MAG: basic amino acid ABC transporter substrate-binding protein [Selenomonadaceae bacterium]|uniref:basic amino acid ABC transporter substrate-binding protein n=1 Tax=Selenomonas bovis TaxID=416586 RepID=UPI0004E1BB18|nr:basic amino acid ABC transporter substrate-binding protein [Selenomonas bovis]MDY6272413.1 basic amino acid ABC transporter substrate-binding protein [Selenomonadaceae bacterium]MDY6298964.1 basic amino acid ABC transporter substrate-binding protein [Selenomonadaceae bacterium]
MKKRFLLSLAACLLGALAMTAGCGSAPDSADTQATEPQVLRVGMDASYPPFGSQNQETKDYEGFDVEISNRSFDGLIPALQAREIDVAINDITITDDRRQSVDFSQPYYIAGLGVVVRADNDTIRTAEDLQGKTLGVSIGSTGEEAARKIPGADVRVFNAINEAFLEVQNGGVDAVVNDIPTNEYYVSHTGSKRVRTAEVALTKEDLGIAVRKGNHALLAKIDDGLAKIKANGRFAEIYEKWFGKQPPQELLQ